jgi:hypothetical protein
MLAAFLRARADGEWSKACIYLTAPTRRQLKTFARASQGKSKGSCGPALAALSTREPVAARIDTLTSGIAALRVQGQSAFALYHGPNNTRYVMPMINENGIWKVSQLAPLPYPLGR